MFYQLFKHIIGVFFNMLNLLMVGNLPPLGCVCIIVEEDHRYLVIKRPRGEYVFPGGFIRWREHPIQTAEREGKEETGLKLQIGDMIGYQIVTSHKFHRMSTLNIIFFAKVVSGELRASIEGQPEWLQEDILQDKLLPMYRNIFDDYRRSRAKV